MARIVTASLLLLAALALVVSASAQPPNASSGSIGLSNSVEGTATVSPEASGVLNPTDTFGR